MVLKCRNEIYQRIELKKGVTCLVVMFTTKVTGIKMSQLAHFVYIILMTTNKK